MLSSRYATLGDLHIKCYENSDGCLVWTGSQRKGYGEVWLKGGRRMQAHRFAWLISGRQVNDDEHIHHRCENRSCLNLDHLEKLSAGEHASLHHNVGIACEKGHIDWKRRPDGRRYCITCHREYRTRARAA